MKNPMRVGVAIILAICFVFVASASYAKPSGKLVLASATDIETLDPQKNSGRVDVWCNHALSDSLLLRDQETSEIGPMLATSIKNIDPTTWEVTLRKDVKFHNGEPFDAESVKFTIERALDPKTKCPTVKNINWVKEVQILDPYTVRLLTHKSYPLVYERLQNFVMLPPKYLQEKGDEYFARNPVGTGPYKVKKRVTGQYIEYEANEDYWRGPASVKTIILKTVPEGTSRIAELLSGSSDIIFSLPPDAMKPIEKSKNCRVVRTPVLRVVFIAFDAVGRGGKNPFMDKRVRQAVNYGVDVDAILKHTLGSSGIRTSTALNPMHFGHDPSIKPYPYDPEKAKKLLAEAGYPNGFECDFFGYGGRFLNARQVQQAIMGYLEKLNIKTKSTFYETLPTYIQLVRAWKSTPMFMLTWGSYATFDADALYGYWMHKDGTFGWYHTPETDKLIDEAASIIDREKRREIYHKIQRIIKEDAPWLFLWAQMDLVGLNKRVDYKPSRDEIHRFYHMKIRK